MGLFSKNKPPTRTVFLVKHDNLLELWKADYSQSGYFVRCCVDTNVILLLPGGRVVGTSSVKGWFPDVGWPIETTQDESFQKLKEKLANEQ